MSIAGQAFLGHKIVAAIYIMLRLSVGAVLLWAGLAKQRQPYDFLSSVYDYELLGSNVGLLVAIVLPWLEIVVGVCLLGGIFVSGALLTGLLLGVTFTFVQASVLYRDLDISCGCFSAVETGVVSYWTLLRAGLFLAATVVVCTLECYPKARKYAFMSF